MAADVMISVNVVNAPIRRAVPRVSIEKPRGTQCAEVERNVEVGASGQRHERALVPEHLHRVSKRAGSEELPSGDGSLHAR